MYKLHLILKYLLKRRIAWVSLAAVMLCTTMVLVVISVMGGWLGMFKKSFRGLTGDIVVHSETLKGFPYYQEIIDRIEKDPACKVEAAIPSIESAALFDFGNGPKPVRVMGIPIAQMSKVNNFDDSLFRQKNGSIPSFELMDVVTTPLASLPAGVQYAKGEGALPGQILLPDEIVKPLQPADTLPEDEKTRLTDLLERMRRSLRYDAVRHQLMYRAKDGPMPGPWKNIYEKLSPDPAFQDALNKLSVASQSNSLIHYQSPDDSTFNGIIVGTGVIGIHREQDGSWTRQLPLEWQVPTHLTVLDLSRGQVKMDSATTRSFYMVDDSHLGVWQYDSNYVYVDFALLQRDLGLDAKSGTINEKPVMLPARATDIHVKMKPGIDPNNEGELQDARKQIERVVNDVFAKHANDGVLSPFETNQPLVDTWQDTQRIWISAVENEKLLTVFLFGIMCIVAIFLIFCIFYMIVVEKTRDIGIIKSVGATSSGVAGIFLGYGLVIGLLGAGSGLLVSYFLVRYINEIHSMLGKVLHIQIWNPQVYLFDKIPNEMKGSDIVWILPTAVLASVLGALIPAIRAARMNPVEALRWE